MVCKNSIIIKIYVPKQKKKWEKYHCYTFLQISLMSNLKVADSIFIEGNKKYPASETLLAKE